MNDMLSKGIIEPAQGSWASPIVLVRKKDGSTRFCVDFRKLSEVTRKDAQPLPRIDDTIDALEGARWFSTLDLASGYWQVEVCLVYLDDIIIFSQTIKEHLERLRDVFSHLRAAGLKVKPSKCHLLQKMVHYFGHIISENGVATDPDKVKCVAEWPTPTGTKELQKFLGLASYY